MIDVSIIICTRNRAESLTGMLRSLAAIRSEHDWEVLLVDNASTDATKQRIEQADDCGGRLRYLYAERIGLGAARDFAWRNARGRIISFSDDDCYVDPGYVDAIVEVFRERPELGGVGGRIMLYDPQDAPVTIDERDEPEDVLPSQFVNSGLFHGANLSIRRDVLEEIGGVDPDLGAGTPFPAEDVDLYARVVWGGYPMRFDPRPVVHHHHGRKASDVEGLFKGYDRGRGAFFAKCLRRVDMRTAYARGWWGIIRHRRYGSDLQRMQRELISGLRYLLRRRAWRVMPLFMAIGAGGYILCLSKITARMTGLADRK